MPGGGGRFFRRYPRDTRVLIGQLAYVFGFGASELLDMEADRRLVAHEPPTDSVASIRPL